MLIQIANLLNLEQVNTCRKILQNAAWIDGKVTAGHQSAHLKHNLQIAEDDADAILMSEIIRQAALSHPLFFSATLPKTLYPPMFNCYQNGGTFGTHVDNAIRKHPQHSTYLRTDVSCTVFFTNPDEYDGGELVIQDTYGTQQVKLPAGHAIVYPSTSLHHVNPVTKGARIASFFWVQSFVASDEKRRLLFELDQNIQSLTTTQGAQNPQVISLTGIYHNLLRQWGEV
jgi:PKHD-type hydroxylase